MPLITTIEEVQAVLSVSNLDQDENIPDMLTTQNNRLLPFLGMEFMNELQEAYDAGVAATDEMKAALLHAQTALAPFAYLDNLGTIHSRLTGAGVRRMTSESMPSVYRWEYEEVKENLEGIAYGALESMLVFLEENKSDYTSWSDSDEYKKRNALLIKSGIDLNEYYQVFQPCRTYHLLIPCLRDVESLHINRMLGKEFFASLKTLEEPTEEEAELILRLKQAIANLAIAQACSKLPVKISENGLTVLSGFGDGKNNDSIAATDKAISALSRKTTEDGLFFLRSARTYVNANASSEIFTDFFTSDFYQDPAEKTFDRGNDRRNIFKF